MPIADNVLYAAKPGERNRVRSTTRREAEFSPGPPLTSAAG